MDKHLIVGMGEIGKAIKTIFTDAQTSDLQSKAIEPPIDVLHICFPYTPDFVKFVKNYQHIFKSTHTIIYSTLPIGTTKQIPGAVHSPIEGRHPDLELSIRTATRWLGGSEKETRFFAGVFAYKFIKTRRVKNSDFTEFLKIRSTAKYGINLIWTDYEKSVADSINMDFELLKDFDRDYNQLYHELGENWAQRYILDPPEGKVGGHCILSNAKLLNEQYPNEWLEKLANYD